MVLFSEIYLQLQLLFKIICQMNIHKLFYPTKRNSGRLIVDEYQQMKRGRDQQGICRYCKHQIPLRLMSSHLNVCTFGSSQQTIHNEQYDEFKSPINMAASTLTQKNIKTNDKKLQQKFTSQRNNRVSGNSAHKKQQSEHRKQARGENSSVRNLSRKKDIISHDRRSLQGQVLNKKVIRDSFSNKKINGTKQKKIQSMNRSLLSDEYFVEGKKKNVITKVKKNPKNIWLESANKKKKQQKELQIKRQTELRKRQQRLKMMQSQAERLKNKQQKLIKQMQREKKTQQKPRRQTSKSKQMKRTESHHKQQATGKNNRNSQNIRNNNNNTRNGNNRNRHPTAQQSYYEQIPVHHPHRTMNFISQTINQQFQMMKEQFQQMNQFFANFVPFSNNGFVYFQRGEESDYSMDEDGSSLGYEDNQEVGLFDQQIQLLPRYVYIKKLGRDDQCAICINSIKHQETVRRLPCQHVFHCECIDEWLRRKAVCPVCRDQIGQ